MPNDNEDVIRVIRVLEYIGRRNLVERTLTESTVKGIKQVQGLTIREAIVGSFPEIIKKGGETDA